MIDKDFERIKAAMRYRVEDIFTGEATTYPLIWHGQVFVGVDWDHPDE